MFKLKEQLEIKIKELLIDISHPNIMLDIWTDATMRSYLGVVCQGINKEWQYKKYALSIKFMKERHLSTVINDMYKEICLEYGIDKKYTKL